MVSQGLGREYCLKNQEQISNALGVTVRGTPMGLPRYYRKYAGVDKEAIVQRAKQVARERIEKLTGMFGNDEQAKVDYTKSVQQLRDETVIAKKQLFRKKL